MLSYILTAFLIILFLLIVFLVWLLIGGYKSTGSEGMWTTQYRTEKGAASSATLDLSHQVFLSCDGRPWRKTKEESCDDLCDDGEEGDMVVFYDDHDGIRGMDDTTQEVTCRSPGGGYDPSKCNQPYFTVWKKYHANTSSLTECPADVESYPAYGGCYLTGKRDAGTTAEKKANDYISRNKLKCYS
jgi:hypothetical protein